jgi:cytosine/adenosine deaminase-related metal-dependent hydrolase
MSVEEVTLADFRLARELDLTTSLHHSMRQMLAPDGYLAAAREGLIGPRINVVHGNELSDRDLSVLVDHGATFCVTVECELQMTYGPPLSGRVRENGGLFGIGSDVECGFGSDMFNVMRMTLQTERYLAGMRHHAATGERPHPITVTTRDVLRWATMDNARMIRMEKRIGSLTPGKAADVILVRRGDLNMVAAANPVHAIVLYAQPRNVDTVIVGGRVMKHAGKLLAGDIDAHTARLVQSGTRIIEAFRAAAPTASFA